jgi:predicted transcriptional regulator
MNQNKFEKLYEPKQKKILLLIPFLQERPRPLMSIANLLSVHPKWASSYIRDLRKLEIDVKKNEYKKYYI